MQVMDCAAFEASTAANSHAEPDPMRVQSLVDDYNKLMDECKVNVEKRREAIRRRWEEKRFQAAVWRDYQLDSAQRLFEAEVEAVEREFEEERGRLKEKLICELLEERKRLMDELEPTLSAGSASTHQAIDNSVSAAAAGAVIGGKRSLRKRTNEDPLVASASATANGANGNGLKTLSGRDTQRRRTGAGNNPYDHLGRMGIDTRLPDDDITEDVRVMSVAGCVGSGIAGGRRGNTAAAVSQTTTNPNNTTNTPQALSPERRRTKPQSGPKGPTAVISGLHDTLIDAHVTANHDAVLHYNQLHVFQKGDPVVVLVTQSDSTFTGTISTIGANELWIRREDGTKNKIYLGQLRIGKYKLAPPNTPFP